jgi:hypothetical protein
MYVNKNQSIDNYASGYNFSGTYYKIEDLVKAIIRECFDLVKSVGINLGNVVETVSENLAAKLVSSGIKKVDDLKNISNTQDLAEEMTNMIFDYLTDVLHVFVAWAGDGEEPNLWWNSQSNQGSFVVETARGIVSDRINYLINKVIKSSGLDVKESSDSEDSNVAIEEESNYEKAGTMQIISGMINTGYDFKQAKTGPEYKGEITSQQQSAGTGTVLPLAIGGAALLYLLI